jgi:fucose 4-O-acetylase-like acetyltransferase
MNTFLFWSNFLSFFVVLRNISRSAPVNFFVLDFKNQLMFCFSTYIIVLDIQFFMLDFQLRSSRVIREEIIVPRHSLFLGVGSFVFKIVTVTNSTSSMLCNATCFVILHMMFSPSLCYEHQSVFLKLYNITDTYNRTDTFLFRTLYEHTTSWY